MPESQARSRGLPALLALAAISLAGSHYVNAGAAHDAAAARHAATAQSSVVSPATPPAGTILNTLNVYCVTCHNSRLKTAGLVLDALDVTRVADHAQQWEKVARKLRTREMPPPGRPRPDSTTYSRGRGRAGSGARRCGGGPPASRPRAGSPIESSRVHERRPRSARCGGRCACAAAIGRGRSGRVRQRRQRAVGVASTAGGLPVGRANISRKAVGDPTLRPVIDSYKISKALVQDDRVGDDLPFGSRGGALIRYYFPVDAEYSIKVLLRRQEYDYIVGMGERHQLDFRLDGALLKRFSVGGEGKGMTTPENFAGNTQGDPEWEESHAHRRRAGSRCACR